MRQVPRGDALTTVNELRTKMYVTLILIFAVGFAIIYAIMLYFGAGLYLIIAVAAGFFLLQWYISPEIMKVASKLRYIGKDEYPNLHATVETLAKDAGVPVPKIAIAPYKEPNAFVFGRTRKSATLVVHEGLLQVLNADELKAVLAHEIGHLKHNDVAVMTVVAFVPMLAYIIAQSMFFSSIFGGMDSRNNSASYLMLFGLLAFVVYIIAQLFMMSLSRTRESYADSYSATYTKHPEYLASSLVKITTSNVGTANAAKDSTVARSFYIVDYFNSDKDIRDIKNHMKEIKDLLPDLDIDKFVQEAKDSKKNVWGLINGAFATHPPAYKRLLDLAREKAELEGRAK